MAHPGPSLLQRQGFDPAKALPLKWSNSAFGLGQVPICPLTFILSPLWGEGRERGTRPAPSWVPKALPSRDSGPMLAIVTTVIDAG